MIAVATLAQYKHQHRDDPRYRATCFSKAIGRSLGQVVRFGMRGLARHAPRMRAAVATGVSEEELYLARLCVRVNPSPFARILPHHVDERTDPVDGDANLVAVHESKTIGRNNAGAG